MIRGVFLKMVITATTTPVEVRVHRFSDRVLARDAGEAVSRLDRKGPRAVDRFLEGMQRESTMHAMLLDAE